MNSIEAFFDDVLENVTAKNFEKAIEKCLHFASHHASMHSDACTPSLHDRALCVLNRVHRIIISEISEADGLRYRKFNHNDGYHVYQILFPTVGRKSLEHLIRVLRTSKNNDIKIRLSSFVVVHKINGVLRIHDVHTMYTKM